MSKPITLKKLNYFRSLALVKRRKNSKTRASNSPKKKKKKTLRERMNAASLALFNRKDKGGNRICRNIFCARSPKDGYYCSLTCRKKFFKYYEDNYMWANVRYKIFKRDRYTCQICKQFYPISSLECDHINPIDLMKENGYKTLNLRAFDEYIYSEKNLRTLCKDCHKTVTKAFMENKRKTKNSKS